MVAAPPGVIVYDALLFEPMAYRDACLRQAFGSVVLGDQTFHGMAYPPSGDVPFRVAHVFPWFEPTLTFLRRSPVGQVEPNDLHDDRMMGEWTGIVYLNPEPPPTDGTIIDGHFVQAQFNRLVIFPAIWPHKRAIFDNYGDSPEAARLIQVTFGGTPTWP